MASADDLDRFASPSSGSIDRLTATLAKWVPHVGKVCGVSPAGQALALRRALIHILKEQELDDRSIRRWLEDGA